MEFFSGHWAIAFFLLPVLIFIRIFGWRVRLKRLNHYFSVENFKLVIPTLRQDRRIIRAVLLFLGVFFLIVAMMRPQLGVESEEVVREGRHIVVALDVSSSMMAQDVYPSRLALAKKEIYNLMSLTEGDKLGLVLFEGTAFVQCPLTLDRSAYRMILDDVRVNMLPRPGTNLATAIRESRELIGKDRASSGVIIVLSDGESFEGNAQDSAKIAGKMGIPIFTIGLGTLKDEPIPIQDPRSRKIVGYKKGADKELVTSRLNADELKEISSITGGGYYPSTGRRFATDQIFRRMVSIESERLEEQLATRLKERYQWPLFLAVILFLAELFIPMTARRMRILILGLLFTMSHPIHAATFSDVREYNRGTDAIKRGDASEALNRFSTLGPYKNAEEQHVLDEAFAAGLLAAGDTDGALRMYEQLQLSATSPKAKADALYNQSVIYGQTGDSEKAVQRLIDALHVYPEHVPSRHNLSVMLMQEKQQQQSENNDEDGEKSEDESEKKKDQESPSNEESDNEDGSNNADESEDDGEDESDSGVGDEPDGQDEKNYDALLDRVNRAEAEARDRYNQRPVEQNAWGVENDW